MHNKKAQIGETTTWVVATVIIIVILSIFIGLSSGLARLKSIELKGVLSNIKSLGFNPEELKSVQTKTALAYSLNSNNKDKIESWIKETGADNEK